MESTIRSKFFWSQFRTEFPSASVGNRFALFLELL